MSNLHFKTGIELEYENQIRGFPHVQLWDVKRDNNLAEIASKVLVTEKQLKDSLDEVHKISSKLKVGHGRGLHIHVCVSDLKDLGAKYRIFRALLHMEPAFFDLAKPHSARVQWCKKFADDVRPAMLSKETGFDIGSKAPSIAGDNGSRYHWCNFNAYRKFGTLEVRLFNTTKDMEVTLGWVSVLQTFFDAVVNGKLRFPWEATATTRDQQKEAWSAIFDSAKPCYTREVANDFLTKLYDPESNSHSTSVNATPALSVHLAGNLP